VKFIKIATILSPLLLFLILGQRAAGATKSPCTRAQEEAADAEADQLKNWAAVYASFKRYASCDDGSIAEGYSDSVAKLLANHWSDFQDLNRLVARSYMFKKFVLRHVDETMSQEEGHQIQQNARLHCPNNGRSLCTSILQQLRRTS
jgi:hypothetical protein